MGIEEIIYKFGKEKDILVGICDANRLDYLDDVDINAPFVTYTKEERINPCLTMPNAKSVIVVGVGYRKKIDFKLDDNARAKFAIGAIGLDYHRNVEEILIELEKEIKLVNDFASMRFVDTGPLVEREFAKKAGIAWQGKSQNIISEKFGSFFNIGYIITDLDLIPSHAYAHDYSECGECVACINACPSKALTIGKFEAEKCISFLTQSKHDLTEKEMKIMGNSLYGCDICQNICKFNKDKYLDDTIDNLESARPKIKDILNLSNKGFKEKYMNTAIGWRGKKVLQRNAIIASVNSRNDYVLKQELSEENIDMLIDDNVIGCAIKYYKKNQ